MPKDAVITVTLNAELHERFMAEAHVVQKPAADILRDFMQDFVERQGNARQHDAWFRAEVEQGLREANDPSVARVSNAEVMSEWQAQRATLERRAAETDD